MLHFKALVAAMAVTALLLFIAHVCLDWRLWVAKTRVFIAWLDYQKEVAIDVFIATANMLDTIRGPLRDRMEIISLAGYTDEEKREIAKRYLVQRQREANGLKPEQVEIDDDALRGIIQDYTREAGVRNLEREIGRALRYAAVRIADGTAQHIRIGAGDLPQILGAPRFESEIAMRTSVPGGGRQDWPGPRLAATSCLSRPRVRQGVGF